MQIPSFENNIFGLIPKEEWLDVGFNVTRPNDPVDALFPDEYSENLVAKWQEIANQYQLPVMADFHSFDSRTNIATRIPVDTHSIEKGLIKVKINQSERMRALLRSGVQNDAMYDYVIRDGIMLADQVVTRTKVAKNEVLATGKMTIKENDLDLTIDYGVKPEQTEFTFDFSEDADIPAQIQFVSDTAQEAGTTVDTIVTSRKVRNQMRANRAIQKRINGTLSEGAYVSNAALDTFLSTEYGINRVITNDLQYAIDGGIGADGRPIRTTKRYFPQNKMTFLGTGSAMTRIGAGLWGQTPEETVNTANTGLNVNQSGQHRYVMVSQWVENDPVVLWTRASGLFMPVIFNPQSIWIATITDAATGQLTVSSAAGTGKGNTTLTVNPAKESSSNLYKVKAGTTAPTAAYGQNVRTWSNWDGTSDLAIATGQKVTVAECTSDYRVIRSGSATVTAAT